jgi:hypothetical protein
VRLEHSLMDSSKGSGESPRGSRLEFAVERSGRRARGSCREVGPDSPVIETFPNSPTRSDFSCNVMHAGCTTAILDRDDLATGVRRQRKSAVPPTGAGCQSEQLSNRERTRKPKPENKEVANEVNSVQGRRKSEFHENFSAFTEKVVQGSAPTVFRYEARRTSASPERPVRINPITTEGGGTAMRSTSLPPERPARMNPITLEGGASLAEDTVARPASPSLVSVGMSHVLRNTELHKIVQNGHLRQRTDRCFAEICSATRDTLEINQQAAAQIRTKMTRSTPMGSAN